MRLAARLLVCSLPGRRVVDREAVADFALAPPDGRANRFHGIVSWLQDDVRVIHTCSKADLSIAAHRSRRRFWAASLVHSLSHRSVPAPERRRRRRGKVATEKGSQSSASGGMKIGL